MSPRALPSIPVRAPYFATRCANCGWRGSSEQAGVYEFGGEVWHFCPSCERIFACEPDRAARLTPTEAAGRAIGWTLVLISLGAIAACGPDALQAALRSFSEALFSIARIA